MRTIRSLLPVLALAILSIIPACGSYRLVSSGGYSFDKTGEMRSREEAGPLDAGVQAIEIDQRFGEVKVHVAAGTPDFQWSLNCWGQTVADAERFIGEIRLERSASNGVERFTLALPENPGPALRGVESHLTVRVPAATQVLVRNRFGDVEVKGIAGKVTGDCEHSSVLLEDLAAPVRFQTSFDDLVAARIAGGELRNQHGELRVDTVGGDLTASTSFQAAAIAGVRGSLAAENSHGKLEIERVDGAVTATTSFASLSVAEVGGAATLRNSHGGIRGRAVAGELDAKSSFGGIQLEVSGARVRAENSHGPIALELTGAALRHAEAETDFADVTVRMPAALSPAIFIDQKHGEISCPLPVHLPGAEAPASAEEIPQLRLKVRHGDIVVTPE